MCVFSDDDDDDTLTCHILKLNIFNNSNFNTLCILDNVRVKIVSSYSWAVEKCYILRNSWVFESLTKIVACSEVIIMVKTCFPIFISPFINCCFASEFVKLTVVVNMLSTYTQYGNENFNYLCNGKCYKTSFTLSLVYIFNYMLSKALCTYSTLIYLEAYFTLGLECSECKEWKHRENYAQFTKSRN